MCISTLPPLLQDIGTWDQVVGAVSRRPACEKPWLASFERLEGVPDHLRLRAVSPDPSVHDPVGGDDRGVAGFARSGAFATHDRGDGVWAPLVEHPGHAAKQIAIHGRALAGSWPAGLQSAK